MYSDQAVKEATLLAKDEWTRNGAISVFGHGMHEQAGLVDLGHIQAVAKQQGHEVEHMGFGMFRVGPRGDMIATFDAGGAMQRHESGFGSSVLMGDESKPEWRRFVRALLATCPVYKTWRKKRKKKEV